MKKEKRQANVPPLRFPEFSGEWRYSPLNEYLYENKERNKTGFFNKTSVLSVSGDFGVVNQIQLLGRSFAGKSVLDYHVVRHGNIIYTKSPLKDFPYGIVKMNEGADGIVSTLYAVYNVRINASGKFIESYFALPRRANKYFKPIVRIGAKHDMKISNSEAIANIVCFPQYVEQQKIAKFLALIDTRIATQNKIIEDLEQLKSALTDQLYSGQLRFHEFADDWGVSTFGHLTEHFSHRNRNSKHYPVFSVTKDTGFIPQEEQFESREIAGDDISSYKIIRQGEFAYNPARINVGSIARYDNETPCLISSLYVCIKPAADIDSDWLLYLLKSKRAIFYYNLYGEGGVRIYLFYPNFSRIKVKVPSIQEQHRIAALLKYIADKILQEKKLKDLYITQKQFLLQRMFI